MIDMTHLNLFDPHMVMVVLKILVIHLLNLGTGSSFCGIFGRTRTVP
jgi:hypothetical protein